VFQNLSSLENLLLYLGQMAPISPALKERLRLVIKEVNIKKSTYLLNKGEVCQHMFFMQKGFARGIFHTKEKEITSWFWKETDLVTSINSFIKQEPSVESIEALEDSQLLQLSYADLQDLYSDFIEFNIIGRKIWEDYFLRSGEILIILRCMTAKERYDQLLNSHPDIFQRTTLHNISSYLGVTKETISRIRKKP